MKPQSEVKTMKGYYKKPPDKFYGPDPRHARKDHTSLRNGFNSGRNHKRSNVRSDGNIVRKKIVSDLMRVSFL